MPSNTPAVELGLLCSRIYFMFQFMSNLHLLRAIRLTKSKPEISGESIWVEQTLSTRSHKDNTKTNVFFFWAKTRTLPRGWTGTPQQKKGSCRSCLRLSYRSKSWITPSHQSAPVRTTFYGNEIHLKRNGNVPCYRFVTNVDRVAIKLELDLGLASSARHTKYQWVNIQGCVSHWAI